MAPSAPSSHRITLTRPPPPLQTSLLREQSLKEAVALQQFQTDASDMEAWLGDTLRQVSSQEVGHDEFSTQTLARKQREVEEEIQSHRPVIDSLQEQVLALPEAYAHDPQVRGLPSEFTVASESYHSNVMEPN